MIGPVADRATKVARSLLDDRADNVGPDGLQQPPDRGDAAALLVGFAAGLVLAAAGLAVLFRKVLR